MKIFSAAVAAILLTAATAASAQSATDVRCVLLSKGFAVGGPDAQGRQLAQEALYFYMGRVSPSLSEAQLKAQLDQQYKTINDTNDGQLMGECIKNFRAGLERFDAVLGPAKTATKPAKPEGR